MSYFKISGGQIYDPANGRDGETGDLWIRDGKIVEAPADDVRPDRILDASGLVVMPGGVDMHCHIAGHKVNTARKMRPEEKRRDPAVPRTAVTRSGTLGSTPSTFVTGYKYIGLGYTSAFDAAVAPLAARHTHEEFEDTPCIDKGFFVLLGNNHFAMRAIADKDPARLQAFLGWLLTSAKAYAPKLVNPGGVEMWKQRARGNVDSIDSPVDHFGVTPREIIFETARAGNRLGLPHPVHLHCNNLGMPGNYTTTLASMEALGGYRGHLTHIQFHSYGGGEGDENSFNSKTAVLADYVNSHPNLTVDVGQVLFGPTTSMTGDGPLGYFLHNVYGTKWFSGDTEMESGCGIAPIEYRNKSLVHALQWAIGLEWFLLVNDPWQVAMSTDHPNGGSFMAYPQIIRLLMDRTFRRDMVLAAHPAVRERTLLGDLDREYTLGEIAVITRAGPARMLGLTQKGHLGPGADADITIYTPHENKQTMFELPRCVIKSGQILVDQGDIRQSPLGKTLHVGPSFDPGVEASIREWFDAFYTIRFANYPVGDEYLPHAEQVACRPDK
ncbi:formylmethanofuran dehydrogenase subunit A [Lignipirellula cremea]|uniref:Formyltransferase/hydrolase complex Fhc subunit A n=1 Tax=Lignipirellula cremea TaxID=2528010 RepID=A0A518E196_9BACT|nr:formylmethanofuran dehydrogenase subunit A [Lignipirellula cremea]QDU97869.1 Formyltransferase/hydrolase complex Fhc subunit A [Lignipirellula cremea]